jgi:hypothetical protein
LKDTEISTLQTSLEAKCQSEQSSNERITRCLNEIARLKKQIETSTWERIQLERADMEKLRIQYLAKQSSQGCRRDQEQLIEMRRDLQRLMLITKQHEYFDDNHYPPISDVAFPFTNRQEQPIFNTYMDKHVQNIQTNQTNQTNQ